MAIVFRNPGLLDLVMLEVSGVSVKGKENAIGRFGTGMKYGIAVFLRLGCAVTLYLGKEKHTFTAQPIEYRGKAIDTVFRDDRMLPFTTQYGAHWLAWQAFREMHSNVKDEGGSTLWSTEYEPVDGETTFIVEGEAAYKAWEERGHVFLETPALLCSNGVVSVHEATGQPYAYYQGIRAATLSHVGAYTYNFEGWMPLTEDRTIESTYYMDSAIARHIRESDDENYLRTVLFHGEHYEAKLSESYADGSISDTFSRVARALHKDGKLSTFGGYFFKGSRARQFAEYRKAQQADIPQIYRDALGGAMMVLAEKGIDTSGIEVELEPPESVEDSLYGAEVDGNVIILDMRHLDGTPTEAAVVLLTAIANRHARKCKGSHKDAEWVLAHMFMHDGEMPVQDKVVTASVWDD